MAAPARDMRENNENTIKPSVTFSPDLYDLVRSYKASLPREIDNFSHAVRLALRLGLTTLRDSTETISQIKARIPNGGGGMRKEILMPKSLFEEVRTIRYENPNDIESDAEAIRLVTFLGLQPAN